MNSKSAIQGLVLFRVLIFISSLIKKVDILSREFDNIENLLYPRVYRPFLLRIIKEKTLIAGYDNESLLYTINKVNSEFDTLKEFIKDSIDELKEARGRMKANMDTHTENMLGFLASSDSIIQTIVEMTKNVKDNLKISIPTSETTLRNAKRLRKLLTDTQAVGRETELLFVYFLKEVLKEHGQIRRDYADIQSQTNQIYDKLNVSLGEIYLNAENLSTSIKMIMKALKNIRGDLNTLKIITIMLMRPTPDSPIQVRNMLSKILEKGGVG